MDTEEALLLALHANPADEVAWLALADRLEEAADPRAELLRLHRELRRAPQGGGHRRAEARVRELLDAGVRPCVPRLRNSIGMELVLIPPGQFVMGSPPDEEGRRDDETQREVASTRPFYLGAFPVTQEEYQNVTGTSPSYFSTGGDGAGSVKGLDTRRFPVEQVSWDDAVAFCKKLSAMPAETRSGRKYRLPTEAEWEYSCRGGARSSEPFHFGASLSSTQANFNGNYPYGAAHKGPYLARTSEVGSYKPNAFGLYDLHGNVWEWCSDWYEPGYYATSPAKDPSGPPRGSGRVLRGGNWYNPGQYCRSAIRDRYAPAYRNDHLGFRVALVPSQ
jgi:uncharacterized protein (TIGR02996 family)